MKQGERVVHPIHGRGTVRTVTPDGRYVTVAYPLPDRLPYIRTHAVARLRTA